MGFDNQLQELLQVLHSGQEKAALKAPDPSVSQQVQILACLALLPASSKPPCLMSGRGPAWQLTWPRTHLPTRPLLKAEVYRKPVAFFFLSGWVGNFELCYLQHREEQLELSSRNFLMFWRSIEEDKFHSSRAFVEGCSGFQKCSRPLGQL